MSPPAEDAAPAATRRRGRRLALGMAVGLAAAAAGVAWRLRREQAPPPVSDSQAQAAQLWSMRLERPEGGLLDMALLRPRPLVLNFWATWCPPCIEELPDIDRFNRAYAPRGWQVVGLAVDRPAAVREFLKRQPLSFAVGMAGLEGTGLSRQLGNTTGALPFTAVFAPGGVLRHRKSGRTTLVELEAWASQIV